LLCTPFAPQFRGQTLGISNSPESAIGAIVPVPAIAANPKTLNSAIPSARRFSRMCATVLHCSSPTSSTSAASETQRKNVSLAILVCPVNRIARRSNSSSYAISDNDRSIENIGRSRRTSIAFALCVQPCGRNRINAAAGYPRSRSRANTKTPTIRTCPRSSDGRSRWQDFVGVERRHNTRTPAICDCTIAHAPARSMLSSSGAVVH